MSEDYWLGVFSRSAIRLGIRKEMERRDKIGLIEKMDHPSRDFEEVERVGSIV